MVGGSEDLFAAMLQGDFARATRMIASDPRLAEARYFRQQWAPLHVAAGGDAGLTRALLDAPASSSARVNPASPPAATCSGAHCWRKYLASARRGSDAIIRVARAKSPWSMAAKRSSDPPTIAQSAALGRLAS